MMRWQRLSRRVQTSFLAGAALAAPLAPPLLDAENGSDTATVEATHDPARCHARHDHAACSQLVKSHGPPAIVWLAMLAANGEEGPLPRASAAEPLRPASSPHAPRAPPTATL